MSSTEVVIGVAGIIVALAAPIIALELQKWLDEKHESRARKLAIFKNLMMYRVTPLSPQFVQSLNLLDLEFNGKSDEEKVIRDKWKILLDHFNNYNAAKEPVEKGRELTAELLKAISKYFDYDFDEVYLKRGGYYPKFFMDVEQEQHALRRGLLDVLNGNRRIPVGFFEQKFPDPIDVAPATASLPLAARKQLPEDTEQM
jgi:septum formation topological specificity factor MinE